MRGLENVEYATGVPQPAQGRPLPRRRHRRRRLQPAPAAGRGGRDHPVQLPGDGPAVDVRERDRLRERLRPQAQREGPVRGDVPGPAVAGGRPARRCLQRGPRRQGVRRRAAAPPRRLRRQLRGLHPDRPLHLRDRYVAGQARPGPRRRQEPRPGAAGRRPRRGRRRPGVRGVRRGRRALHGAVRGGRRGHRGRCPRRGAGAAAPQAHRGPGQRPRHRHGPADHPRAPRPGGRLRAPGRGGRRHRGRRRPHRRPAGRGLLPRDDPARPGHARR